MPRTAASVIATETLAFVVAATLAVVLVGCSSESEGVEDGPETSGDGGGLADAAGPQTDSGRGDAGDLGGGAPDLPPSEVDVRQWCLESTQVLCEWMYRCFDAADLERAEDAFQMTETSCHPQFDASCQGRTMRSVSEERQQYDGSAAAECLAALRREPCGTMAQMAAAESLAPPECEQVTTGVVPPGDACTNTPDCASTGARCADGICTGTLGAAAFVATCTEDSASECAGQRCHEFEDAAASATGVCTATCRADTDCGAGAGCFRASGDAETSAAFCLALCEDDRECGGSLVCASVSPTRRACYAAVER